MLRTSPRWTAWLRWSRGIANLVEKTRQEPDCIRYELFIDQKDSGHFIFIETWPDRAALDRHCSTERFRSLGPQIDSRQRQAAIFSLADVFADTSI